MPFTRNVEVAYKKDDKEYNGSAELKFSQILSAK